MLEVVRGIDDAQQMRDWLHRQPSVAIDTETTGLDVFSPSFRVRLTQFGTSTESWVIPTEGWEGFVRELIQGYRGRIIMHNSMYDVHALRSAGVHVPWWQVDDTMIALRLAEPHRSAALKTACTRYVSAGAAASQSDLHTAMRKNKWTWATVPLDFEPYVFYAAMDTVLTHRLAQTPVCQSGFNSPMYRTEMDVLAMCSEMERQGMRVNVEFCEETTLKLSDEIETIKHRLESEYGVQVSSPAKLGRWLQDAGVRVPKRTGGGAPSVDKESLTIIQALADNDAARHVYDVVSGALRVRSLTKINSSYFTNFLEMNENGLLHPSINTMAAKTGRMCLPDSHRLFTKRGVLSINDVKIGDLTLDELGNWVSVEAVHRYQDQPIDIWDSSTAHLECTSDHRWVGYSERGVRYVEPIGPRRTLRLAPADLFDRTNFDPVYKTGSVGAIVGWLVSDGRCVWKKQDGSGLRAYIYQRETKFYKQILHAIPDEGLMYDRITNKKDHHEIRLKTKWIRPILEDEGFNLEGVLAENSYLPRWVANLPLEECHAFLQAVWLADGTTTWPNSSYIACGRAALREAIQIAAYRCGKLSYITNADKSAWSTKDRLGVKIKRSVVSTRPLKRSEGRSDVWCVSTATGTFTAWDRGPYLTGNSVRSPALQTLPRGDNPDAKLVRSAIIPRNEGELLVSCDYEQIELRLISGESGDEGLIEAFRVGDSGEGADFFTETMRAAYGDPTMQKSNPLRTHIKTLMYASVYGAGIAKMAHTSGIPEEEMRDLAARVFKRYPGVKKYMRTCEQEALNNDNWVTTPYGRKVWVDPDHSYKALNAKIQGFAADIFKKSMVNLGQAGLTEYMCVPVHDEMLFSIPEDILGDVQPIIESSMTSVWAGVDLPAEPSPGALTWGDVEK